jgi:transposase
MISPKTALALLATFSYLSTLTAQADPYTFTPKDFIEYGIYFAERGNGRVRAHKLLELRYGDIEGYYRSFLPKVKPEQIPSRSQRLKLKTAKGSVQVRRNDDTGVTVTRDVWNEKKRSGTKRLEVRFENATCTDAQGTSSPCSVDLLLTTDVPDKLVVREARTLLITTSTGLSFRYRSPRVDGGKPLNRALINRSPVISNYAWEWRG